MKLEAWKFGVYILVPIAASAWYNNPDIQKRSADYFQFMKYPPSPNTNLREEFESLVKKREVERGQRSEYAAQMKKLQEAAQNSRAQEDAGSAAEKKAQRRAGWFRWLPLGQRRDETGRQQ